MRSSRPAEARVSDSMGRMGKLESGDGGQKAGALKKLNILEFVLFLP